MGDFEFTFDAGLSGVKYHLIAPESTIVVFLLSMVALFFSFVASWPLYLLICVAISWRLYEAIYMITGMRD